MKYCEKCKVFVAGERDKCPLCQNSIKDTNSGNSGNSGNKFPDIKPHKSKLNFIWRLFIFITTIIVITTTIINFEVSHNNYWCRFVAIGIFTLWVCLYVLLKKHKNILKCLLYETVAITAFIVSWDFYTGWHGWSIDFVMPILFSLVIFTMGLLSKVLKIDAEEHIIYLVSLVLFGMVPGVLWFSGKLNVTLPSEICTGISIIAFFTVLLFEGKKMWVEFTKRLHI